MSFTIMQKWVCVDEEVGNVTGDKTQGKQLVLRFFISVR